MMWAPQEKSSPTIYHHYYIKNTHTAADISVQPLSDSVSRDMHLTSLGAKVCGAAKETPLLSN